MGHAADVYSSMPGDLLLTINIGPHDFFERKDKDIYSDVSLTLSEALLGCPMTIQTVHGPLNIQVAAGVCSDDTLVLKQWGVPEFNPGEMENYDPID